MCSFSPAALLHSVNRASFHFYLHFKWFISSLSDFYLGMSLVCKIRTAAQCRPAVVWGHLLRRATNVFGALWSETSESDSVRAASDHFKLPALCARVKTYIKPTADCYHYGIPPMEIYTKRSTFMGTVQ